MRIVSCILLALVLQFFARAAEPKAPKGFMLPDSSLSPDKRFGMSVPESFCLSCLPENRSACVRARAHTPTVSHGSMHARTRASTRRTRRVASCS
jgi:hypothetical protein